MRRVQKGQVNQALGRSRGGFSTKIHIASTESQKILRFTLTGGQDADINQADTLLDGLPTQKVVADRAYDCDPLINSIRRANAQAVIPPRSNKIVPTRFR